MMFYPSNAAFPGLQTAFQESPSFFLELSAKFFDSFRLSDKVVKKSSYNIRKNNNYDPDKACISFIRFLHLTHLFLLLLPRFPDSFLSIFRPLYNFVTLNI